MYFARYFPGLELSIDDVEQMTPDEIGALRKAGGKILRGESEERLAIAQALIRAAGRR